MTMTSAVTTGESAVDVAAAVSGGGPAQQPLAFTSFRTDRMGPSWRPKLRLRWTHPISPHAVKDLYGRPPADCGPPAHGWFPVHLVAQSCACIVGRPPTVGLRPTAGSPSTLAPKLRLRWTHPISPHEVKDLYGRPLADCGPPAHGLRPSDLGPLHLLPKGGCERGLVVHLK